MAARRLKIRWILAAAVTAAALSSAGCSFSFEWLQHLRAQRAIAAQDYPKATTILLSMIERNPDGPRAVSAARQGARIAHLDSKDYPLAVHFYKHVVLKSDDAEERKSAQRFIAQIYFENLLDYDQAVIEYEKLLKLDHRSEEAFRYRLNLAKSHFQMNNLEQALNEIDSLLTAKNTPEDAFEAKVLRASVLMQQRNLQEAAVAWEGILKDYPERSQKENVALNLVVCYEDLKDFGKAIEVLERMKADYPNPDFLELRIAKLRERQLNQPGAQGWKR